MLAASWALVHPPWIPALRLHLRWEVISRSVSQSKTPATPSFLSNSRPHYPSMKTPSVVLRRSHGSQISANKLAHLVAEGKYQLAEKFRAELLELGVEIPGDGVYEGVVEELIRKYRIQDITLEFKNWLALLPNAQSPEQEAFSGIRQLLQASPEANLPLIIQFGVVCASKGYALLVYEELMPLVARHADASVYAQFVKDVEAQAQEHQTKSKIQTSVPSEAVFEDTSDDYNIVNSEAAPPPPSILDLVTNNLPKILPKPLLNDTMVFEDESDYDYVSYVSTSPPTSLPDALAQLVSDDLYEEAYRFLLEIQDVGGVHVHHSPVYEKAALAALDSSSALAPQERLTRFTSWISLIPPVHLAQPLVQFLEIRELIFRAPQPNYLLVASFATILASKGYADLIIPHTVPLIMHFAPENVSRQFIADFEKADEAYWTTFKPEEALERTTNTKRELRAVAVKYLAYLNRFETATFLLPKADDPFRLSPEIYDDITRSHRSSHTFAATEQVAFVENLHKQEAQLAGTMSSNVHEQRVKAEVSDFGDKFHDLSPTNFGQDIGRAVLYLRKALESEDNLPHPLALSEWFEHYTSSSSKRKRRAITTLRNKALRSGARSAKTYLFAEMHYYWRTGNHDFVIKTFADHFYLIGVPQDDVLGHYQRINQALASKYQNEESPVSAQLHQYAVRQVERNSTTGPTAARFPRDQPNFKLARRKLWPGHSHTTLVWHALLNLAPSDADVDKLYQKLVRIATTELDASHATSDGSSLLPPPSWTHNVGMAAFTPFIRKLMVGFGTSRGAIVLSDMLKAGLEPTLHHFTELAGLYARLGDASRAFMILDRMEAAKDISPDSDVRDAPPSASQDRSVGLSFPAPDVVLYISLLRGFLISRDLQAIDEVDRRLKKHHQYTPGENLALDEVYVKIVQLREELGKSGLDDVDD